MTIKTKSFQTVIASLISLLLAYGMSSFHRGNNHFMLFVGSFIFLSGTLITSIGLDFQNRKVNINIKVVGLISFIIALISNLIFTFLNFSNPSYIIINGLLFLVFLLTVYSIQKSKIN